MTILISFCAIINVFLKEEMGFFHFFFEHEKELAILLEHKTIKARPRQS